MVRIDCLSTWLTISLVTLSPAARADSDVIASSTFDASEEGWTEDQANDVTWRSSGGNPDGYLHFIDSGFGSTEFMVAPASFLGDWSAIDGTGEIRFDHKIFDAPSDCSVVPHEIRISGPSGHSATWLGPVGDRTWRTFRARLIESEWTVNGSWSTLLADVRHLRIRIETVNNTGPCNNNEETGLDNVLLCGCAMASWNNYGEGFPGTTGIPSLTADAVPCLGCDITIEIGNSRGASTIGVLFVGLDKLSAPGSWGGDLLVSPLLTIVLGLPASGLPLPASIPDDAALCGTSIVTQVLELDPGAASGISSTPGLELILGS